VLRVNFLNFVVWAIILLTTFKPSMLRSQPTNPEWYQQTVIYQIYPRSFQDSNDDGIGDLNGIINRLDYLKDLGVETIWISPFYQSPQQDFGYDISNYLVIAPEYGTMEDAERLIAEVHRRQMYIVLDMVMNHTSDEHEWFTESKSNRTNPKSDWYIWKDGKGNKPPNNWHSMIGERGWHYEKTRDQWYYASFLPFQPDLNYRNEEVKNAMFDIVRFWLNKGVDGFRLDIFNAIMKDSSFKDNPFSLRLIPGTSNPDGLFQEHRYNINHSDGFVLAKDLRKVIDEYDNPKRFTLGEVFGPHPTIKQYLGNGTDALNLVFQFDLLHFKFNATFFKQLIQTYGNEYPAPYLPTLVLGNHDQKRSIGRVNNNREKAKLLALFQLTARGVPVMYMGEEIGMTNANIPLKKAKDPVAKRLEWLPQWIINLIPVALNRDICRTPMQWNNNRNAGFSDATPWLPVNPDVETINVETQIKDSSSLLNTYRNLLLLRKTFTALQSGNITLIKEVPADILAYQRQQEGELVIGVYLNFSEKPVKVASNFTQLMLQTQPGVRIEAGWLILPPLGGVVVN